MNRAYSILELKSVDAEKRILTGIATTPATDRMDDIVEPKGAVFNLPIPFLWQHRADQPVGHVIRAKVSDAGIDVTVQMVKPGADAPAPWADRLNSAWADISSGLVRGLSIGFKPLEHAAIDGSWGSRFTKWAWLELSGVTIAANMEASIQTIKSIDMEIRSGRGIKLLNARDAALRNGAVDLRRKA
jgi:uncharacterized protein